MNKDSSEQRTLEKLIKLIRAAEDGRFNDVGFLGQGGHAYTFKVSDTWKRFDVVIKIPKKGIKGIEVEGLRAGKVGVHPNIVRPIDFFSYEDGKNALIMEYVDGKSLKDLLYDGNVDVNVAVKFLVDICNALQCVHEHPDVIIHRDVKPANVLLSYSGISNECPMPVAKLTDFGIALEVGSNINEILGSLPYMPPEQLDSSVKGADPRSDLYSATVVFYELLQGSRPFEGQRKVLAENIRNSSPKPLSDNIPSVLKKIIYKGLQKDPANRYQSATEMLCDLEVYQYFADRLVKVSEDIEAELSQKYSPWQERIHDLLSEMHIHQSIYCLGKHRECESDLGKRSPHKSFRMAMLHGAISEYDKAESEIQETQKLDSEDAQHPLDQDHPFIKRLAKSEKVEELHKEIETEDEQPTESKETFSEKIAAVKKLLDDIEYSKAIAAADEILNADDNVELYIDLCKLFYGAELNSKVIELCERCLEIHEAPVELKAVLAAAAVELGEHTEKAIGAIEEIQELGIDYDSELLRDLGIDEDLLDDIYGYLTSK